MIKTATLLIDTETTGLTSTARVYDIGYLIISNDGKQIYKQQQFAVQESLKLLSNDCYGLNFVKMKYYLELVSEQKMQILPYMQIMWQIAMDIDDYNVTTIAGYNLSFTLRLLRQTGEREYLSSLGMKPLCYLDLWINACTLLFPNRNYIRACIKNDWFSNNGNPLTNAKVGYSYLNKQEKDTYQEELYDALDNCFFELDIYKALKKQYRPLYYLNNDGVSISSKGQVDGSWKTVANYYRKNAMN